MIDIGHNIWDISYGRGGETRTHGLYVPNVARYRTVLHPDGKIMWSSSFYHNIVLSVPNVARYHTALHPVVVPIFFSRPNVGLGVQHPLDLVQEDQFPRPRISGNADTSPTSSTTKDDSRIETGHTAVSYYSDEASFS